MRQFLVAIAKGRVWGSFLLMHQGGETVRAKI